MAQAKPRPKPSKTEAKKKGASGISRQEGNAPKTLKSESKTKKISDRLEVRGR